MTSEESLAAWRATKAERHHSPYEFTKEEWRTFSKEQKEARYKLIRDWEREREKREQEALKAIIPGIGQKCTVCYYSDYHAATVTRVITPHKIAVQDNKTKCIDYQKGEYEILDELEAGEMIFTKRRNGKWILDGHKSKDGVRLCLHYQRHYIDPEF